MNLLENVKSEQQTVGNAHSLPGWVAHRAFYLRISDIMYLLLKYLGEHVQFLSVCLTPGSYGNTDTQTQIPSCRKGALLSCSPRSAVTHV